MILARSTIAGTADRFVRRFEQAAPDSLAGCRRRGSIDWKGDRLGLHYDWSAKSKGTIAVVRMNLDPAARELWLGSVEVHPYFRGRRIGTRIVLAVETAARADLRRIRLFSRFVSSGFWRRLGYQEETDPRYFAKSIHFRRGTNAILSHPNTKIMD